MGEEKRDVADELLTIISRSGGGMYQSEADLIRHAAAEIRRLTEESRRNDLRARDAEERLTTWRTRAEAAEAKLAASQERDAWARDLIEAAVNMMTRDQIGQWNGVRAWQELEPEACYESLHERVRELESDNVILRDISEVSKERDGQISLLEARVGELEGERDEARQLGIALVFERDDSVVVTDSSEWLSLVVAANRWAPLPALPESPDESD